MQTNEYVHILNNLLHKSEERRLYTNNKLAKSDVFVEKKGGT